ncbi:MAG: hypothetical protein QXO51_06495 [Halobacteria archaeon]
MTADARAKILAYLGDRPEARYSKWGWKRMVEEPVKLSKDEPPPTGVAIACRVHPRVEGMWRERTRQ